VYRWSSWAWRSNLGSEIGGVTGWSGLDDVRWADPTGRCGIFGMGWAWRRGLVGVAWAVSVYCSVSLGLNLGFGLMLGYYLV
jgi:hypothetical protein